MVDRGWFSDNLMQGMANKFYDQFLERHWAPIEQFGQPPAQRPNRPLPGDTLYPKNTQQRLWQTWIAYQRPPVLELEVRYPEQILESVNGQSYMFRVDVGASSSEADLKSDAFSKEPNSEMVLSSQSTRLLSLQVPHASE